MLAQLIKWPYLEMGLEVGYQSSGYSQRGLEIWAVCHLDREERLVMLVGSRDLVAKKRVGILEMVGEHPEVAGGAVQKDQCPCNHDEVTFKYQSVLHVDVWGLLLQGDHFAGR
jgi:hypothetical protein